MFLCNAAMTKRGNRGLDQRVTSVIPSATLAVSSTSATKPVPRVRYQSACVFDDAAIMATANPRRA